MAMTFVYNDGNQQTKESISTIELQLGFFFDGTTNNMYNTELSQKIQKGAGYVEELQVDDYKHPTEVDILAYDKYKMNSAEDIRNKKDIDSYNFTAEEKEAFLKRDFLEPVTSYVNDQTNVVRIYQQCDAENYAIYIEGIGTKKYLQDNQEGYALGNGITGIKKRAKEALEELKQRIVSTSNKPNKNLNKVTIDVFGFSRGAATARHFIGVMTELFITGSIYEMELKKKKNELESKKEENKTKYKNYPNEENKQEFLNSKNELNRFESIHGKIKNISPSDVKSFFSKLDKMGLEEKDLIEFKTIKDSGILLEFRFMGIYDTVSSYATKWDVVKGGISKTLFNQNEEQLYMHDLDRVKKVVHFTALDEHRENFSLTRIKNISHAKNSNRIEKNFPGVHSDIGGSYINETEKVHITDEYFMKLADIKSLYGRLIYEGWFSTDQLELKVEEMNISDNINRVSTGDKIYLGLALATRNPILILLAGGIVYFKNKVLTEDVSVLRGWRYIRKEYSYIPLHFMYEYFLNELGIQKNDSLKVIKEKPQCYMINTDLLTLEKIYSLEIGIDELYLKKSKERLRPYVFNEGGVEWKFDHEEMRNLRNKTAEAICQMIFKEDKTESGKCKLTPYNDVVGRGHILIQNTDRLPKKHILPISKSYSKDNQFDSNNAKVNFVNEKGYQVSVDRVLELDYKDEFWKNTTIEEREEAERLLARSLSNKPNGNPTLLLKGLRNLFLHYSAHYDNNVVGYIFAMAPRDKRVRQEFPKK